MKKNNNLVIVDRQLSFKSIQISNSSSNHTDTDAISVNVTVHCSVYLYMGIYSVFFTSRNKEADGVDVKSQFLL